MPEDENVNKDNDQQPKSGPSSSPTTVSAATTRAVDPDPEADPDAAEEVDVEDADAAFIGVDPIYQNFANATDAPLLSGDEKEREREDRALKDAEDKAQLAENVGPTGYRLPEDERRPATSTPAIPVRVVNDED